MRIVTRFTDLDREAAAAERVNTYGEIVEEVCAIGRVRGLHEKSVSWASILPELLTRLGCHPRPQRPASDTKVVTQERTDVIGNSHIDMINTCRIGSCKAKLARVVAEKASVIRKTQIWR